MTVRCAQRRKAEQRSVLPAADHEMRSVAVFTEHVARSAERVLPLEMIAHDPDADGAARLKVRISHGHAIGLGKGARDDLGDRGCGAVDHRRLRQRTVDRGEGWPAERAGQGVGPVPNAGGDRAGRRRSDDDLLLNRIPPTDLDGAHLLRGRHARPEFDQVVAKHELQWIGVVLVIAGLGSARRLHRLAEIEFAVFHAHLEADLPRARLEEIPARLVGLRHMVEGDACGIDLADLQAGTLGNLAGDVRIRHILIGLGFAAPVQPVGLVVASQDGAQPGGVVFGFEPGDLTLDQGLGATARRCHLDGDGRTNIDVELADDVASGVVEADGKHVGQVLVMINDDLLEQRRDRTGERGSIDLDVGPEMMGLGHSSFPC